MFMNIIAKYLLCGYLYMGKFHPKLFLTYNTEWRFNLLVKFDRYISKELSTTFSPKTHFMRVLEQFN